MTNPDFLTMGIEDIMKEHSDVSDYAKPSLKLMAVKNWQRALAAAYSQHSEFLGSWIIPNIHQIDHDLLFKEHQRSVGTLFEVIGVSKATIDLLVDAEFSSGPL